MANYVENGGAVLVASGAHYAAATSLYRTPLSQILPAAPTGRVIERAFRPETSDLGKKHPVTRALSGSDEAASKWGRWFRLIEASSSSGRRPDVRGPNANRSWFSTGAAKDGWHCCCPIMPGFGRAAMRAVAPTRRCCAGLPTG